MNTKTTIKITKLEIKLLNEIVNNMYDGGESEFTSFVINPLESSCRKLTREEKGVMSSLLKKNLVRKLWLEMEDENSTAIFPTRTGIAASINFFKQVFGNQTSEFKNQFGFDTDLEYLEDLKGWFGPMVNDNMYEPLDHFRFDFELSYKEAHITYKGLENELNKAFNKLVENDEDKTRVAKATEAHEGFKKACRAINNSNEEFKTLAKRPIFSGLADLNNNGEFKWTDDLVAEFAKICSNKSRLKNYGLLSADIAQLITTEDKMRAFKEACMR